jgi:4-diphosphocytidyl-2-C-methyl-D-erythritol kinase
MVVFPNCKINLGLHIVRKRPDGYHDIETVFLPVPVTDVLEVVTAGGPVVAPINFRVTGLPVAGDPAGNLCLKAWGLLKADFPDLPPVQMQLHKIIPMGAGLGGGSADGAFTLTLLNRKYALGLSEDQLMAYALQLGSDCPFFIRNTLCYAEGRGEVLTPVTDHTLTGGYRLALVNPGIHVATGWAFSHITPAEPAQRLTDIIRQPVAAWKGQLTNDFEAPVMEAHPELADIRQQLYAAGAEYAAMTGTGSTVFGLFAPGTEPVLQFPGHYFVKTVVLQ